METAKASRLPSIQLQAQARADLNGGKTSSAVGITTGVDLSSNGLGRRQVQAATMNVRAAESSLLATRRTLTNKVNSALEQLRILRRSEASRVKQIAEARKVLENYETQFVAGQRELIDLLTTGRDLYDSEIEALDTKDERKRTEYQAAHDLGVLGTLIVASSRG
ncbi:TolC family protein [Rhodobacteraceae bacterium D3-12]|nr:TolC family protein [Rhodobacteraceae bacterium D3-12]